MHVHVAHEHEKTVNPERGTFMVHYTGINHLAMATRDMDRTIRFWRDLLGLRMVAGLGRPGYRHYFFEISAHDMIAFFEWPHVQEIPPKDHGVPVKGPFAFDHVSLEVESDEDLWELKDCLGASGNWVSEVVDHGFIHLEARRHLLSSERFFTGGDGRVVLLVPFNPLDPDLAVNPLESNGPVR